MGQTSGRPPGRQAGWYRGPRPSRRRRLRSRPRTRWQSTGHSAGSRRKSPSPSSRRGVLRLWDEIDAFATSVEMRPPESEFTFYDGPPFPTGSPALRHPPRRGAQGRGAPLLDDARAPGGAPLRLGHPRPAHRDGGAAGSWACPARPRSRPSEWSASTRPPGPWWRPTPSPGRPTPGASGAGWTSSTTTRPSTSASWSRCGGCSAACGTRASSTATSRCCPTPTGRPPPYPTSKPTWTTATWRTRRSPCASRCSRAGGRCSRGTTCWCGPPPPGPCRPTWRSPSGRA